MRSHRFSLLMGMLFIVNASIFAQNCATGCTISVTQASATSYTITAGQKLCITATGIVTGAVTLNGGTICNEGTFNPSTFSYLSGTFNNYGTFTRPANLSLDGAAALTNNTGANLNAPGSFNLNLSAAFISNGTFFCCGTSTIGTGTITVNTTGITNSQYTISGAGLTGTFNTGAINTHSPTGPAAGQFNTIQLNLLAANDNTPLNLYFDIDNTFKISNVKAESAALSPDYYALSPDQKEIRFLADGILNKETAANAINITINIKDGLVLTPNAAQYNTFEILGLGGLQNTNLVIYNNQSAVVFQTTSVSTVKWDGKVGGVVVPGLYKFDLTVEGQVFNGQFFVN